MRIKTPRLLVLWLTGMGLAALFCGFAYITNSDTGLPLKWTPGSIAMRLMLDDVTPLSDGLTRAKSVQVAMVDPTRGWNANLGTVQFAPTIVPVGSGGTDNNRINEIFFASSPYGGTWESNTLAVTTAWYSGNRRVEGDIIFNTAFTWNSYRGPKQSAVDVQRVGLHELGHVLGLDHPDEAGQTVAAVMNSHVSNTDSLTADDIAGAQGLYGPPGVPANDNFIAAVPISFGATTTTVTGFNTNATKEAGEPNHAGNNGGHSVWWKWTAPSGGAVTLNTQGSLFDTTLGVYVGSSVNALTTITSNDDVQSGIVQYSAVTFTAIGGTTYYFAVDGFNAGASAGADSAAITLNLTLTGTGTTSITTTTTIPPTSGGGGGGGGGGAPSGWFLGALGLLAAARKLWRKRA